MRIIAVLLRLAIVSVAVHGVPTEQHHEEQQPQNQEESLKRSLASVARTRQSSAVIHPETSFRKLQHAASGRSQPVQRTASFPTPSPSSSSKPSTSSSPTSTNSPSATTVAVLLMLVLDYPPGDVFWRLETIDGDIVYDRPPGTYANFTSSATIREVLTLDDREDYILNVTTLSCRPIYDTKERLANDCAFSGQLYLFRGLEGYSDQLIASISQGGKVFSPGWVESGSGGDSRQRRWRTAFRTDEILLLEAFLPLLATSPAEVRYNPPPTIPAAPSFPSASLSPTASASPSVSSIDVLLKFMVNSYPGDVWWRIETIDGDVVYTKPPGTYRDQPPGAIIKEVFSLDDHGSYYFYVADIFCQPIGDTSDCDFPGLLYLYRGAKEDPNQILVSWGSTLTSGWSESGNSGNLERVWRTSFETARGLPPTTVDTTSSPPAPPVRPPSLVVHPSTPAPVPAGSLSEPAWWPQVSTNFVGINLRVCIKRMDVPPIEGRRCGRKPKTCFFGVQQCPSNGVGPHPVTRCFCDGLHGDQAWTCKEVKCPSSPTAVID